MSLTDIKHSKANSISENVKDYYGNVLTNTSDLKTSACCTSESLPSHHKEILANIDDEIMTTFYGCGSPIPEAVEGRTILDLGCGTGRDVYLASKLAGPNGFVIGIDMTDEQLDVARRHVHSQMDRFGFKEPNVDFRKGYIEDLALAGIEDQSIDVVISNCVINLSPEKRAVFKEIFRVLKPGENSIFPMCLQIGESPKTLLMTLFCMASVSQERSTQRIFDGYCKVWAATIIAL